MKRKRKNKDATLDETLIRILTAVILTNGATVLKEQYNFDDEQATAWVLATASRATATINRLEMDSA